MLRYANMLAGEGMNTKRIIVIAILAILLCAGAASAYRYCTWNHAWQGWYCQCCPGTLCPTPTPTITPTPTVLPTVTPTFVPKPTPTHKHPTPTPTPIPTVTPTLTTPTSITGVSYGTSWCTNAMISWTNPTDADFSIVYTMKDNVWMANITAPTHSTFWNGLEGSTEYLFSSFTCDTTGNCNSTWVNQTITTFACENPIPSCEFPWWCKE